MAEDRPHLGLIDAIVDDLERLASNVNKHCRHEHDDEKLIQLLYRVADAAAEIAHRHRRHLDFALGKPVAPETHFVEGTLTGMGGGLRL